MVTITERAAEQVRTLMEQEPEANVLRVAVQGGGCSGLQYALGFDNEAQPGDAVAEHHGVTVIVDRFSLPYLDGAGIDFVDGLMGQGSAVSSKTQGRSARTFRDGRAHDGERGWRRYPGPTLALVGAIDAVHREKCGCAHRADVIARVGTAVGGSSVHDVLAAAFPLRRESSENAARAGVRAIAPSPTSTAAVTARFFSCTPRKWRRCWLAWATPTTWSRRPSCTTFWRTPTPICRSALAVRRARRGAGGCRQR